MSLTRINLFNQTKHKFRYTTSLLFNIRHLATVTQDHNIKKRDVFDNSFMIDKNLYDIAIIGGGITGNALACALDIGVWENINHERIRPYKDIQVWDGISDARIRFNSDERISINKNVEAIAWIIENNNIQHAILTKLAQYKDSNIDFLENTSVKRIMFDDVNYENEQFDLSDWPSLELSNGKIGADGINSVVRSFANIESLGWDYNARAVVATLQVEPQVENATAWQRFLPTGPIAMLPLNNRFSSMVWSTTPTLASKICTLPSNNFIHLVNAAFRLRIADLEYLYSQLENSDIEFAKEFEWRQSIEKKPGIGNEISPPLVLDVQEKSRAEFPLKMRNAESYVKERIALIGDAAHTIHPLAGQGLNQGLADVQSLVKVIEHGVVTGQDLGNIQLLKNYSSDRYLSNLIMLGAVDKLHKLFGNDFAPIVFMRSLGLQVINNLEPVKSEIIKYAMGIE
ncbi:43348_t:CDS:2 [Gigaspora margarita]|uniref:Ubiquinone biosynthesis monooxygenase COQ6, mitochondrial n=1 Tax=Gigaspora margarita TaxID=4874 RepID=A0ABN7VI56_GIGMA|nr:43348_t:CDS:2 [Gigaspora margarita]